MQENFAVGFGGEGMPSCEQLLPQRAIIVDFAVKHQHFGLILIINRLATSIEVDDAQPPKRHGDGTVQIISLGIRAAMGDSIGHLPDNVFPMGDLARKTTKSAHIGNPLFFRPVSGLV